MNLLLQTIAFWQPSPTAVRIPQQWLHLIGYSDFSAFFPAHFLQFLKWSLLSQVVSAGPPMALIAYCMLIKRTDLQHVIKQQTKQRFLFSWKLKPLSADNLIVCDRIKYILLQIREQIQSYKNEWREKVGAACVGGISSLASWTCMKHKL